MKCFHSPYWGLAQIEFYERGPSQTGLFKQHRGRHGKHRELYHFSKACNDQQIQVKVVILFMIFAGRPSACEVSTFSCRLPTASRVHELTWAHVPAGRLCETRGHANLRAKLRFRSQEPNCNLYSCSSIHTDVKIRNKHMYARVRRVIYIYIDRDLRWKVRKPCK